MPKLSLRALPILLVLCLLLSPSGAATAAGETVDQKERCPVCGMFVAPFPDWLAVVTLDDGRTFYFDGPKDMFSFLFAMSSYVADASLDDVIRAEVTEYYSTRRTDAREVFFVRGSSVSGPMGAELVPVAGKDNAEAFLRDHGGKAILRFDGRELHEVVTRD